MQSNPYSFLSPVLDPALFYGYASELEYIVSRVTELRKTSFFVAAGSRMGKTTLLRQIERRLKEVGSGHYEQLVVPLYLDMLQMGDITLNDLFGKFARLLKRYFVAHSITLSSKVMALLDSLKTDSEPIYTFIDALSLLAQETEPVHLRIVFLIDDLWRARRESNSALITSLRGIHTEPILEPVIAYVITGSHHEAHSLNNDSPLENMLMQQELHVFSEEQTLALINIPTERAVPADVARQIYIETGGHPFLIQCLMTELCDYEDLSQLTTHDVYQTTLYFLRERRDFERWWEKLTAADKRIYEALRQTGYGSIDTLRRMMLSVPIDGGRSQIISVPMIRDSLRSLSTMGLIRQREEWENETLYEIAGQWHARWFEQTNRTTQQL